MYRIAVCQILLKVIEKNTSYVKSFKYLYYSSSKEANLIKNSLFCHDVYAML